MFLLPLPLFLVGMALAPPPGWAEGPILLPRLRRTDTGGVIGTYEVDRAEDHFGVHRESPPRPAKVEDLEGLVAEGANEFGHVRVSVERRADLSLEILEGCVIVQDRQIPVSDLEPGQRLLLFGAPRGYVPGLPKGETPRRIFGSRLLVREEAPSQAAPAAEASDASAGRPSHYVGEIRAVSPLLVQGADGVLYEVRPGTPCPLLSVRPATREDLAVGTRIRARGSLEQVTLHPRGRTLSRRVFKTRRLRLLAPEVARADYARLLKLLEPAPEPR